MRSPAALLETWETLDTVFIFLLALSLLTILYAITLIHNKLRLIENELQSLRKDQNVISEELELMAQMRQTNGHSPDHP